jgi:hypothetical protein
VLQVCIDDSKGRPEFVLAGYVASVQDWEAFSDEWQELLADCDLAYIKGNELTRVLRHLEPEERDLKLAKFGQLLKKRVSYGLDYSVSYGDYKWFIVRAKKEGRRVDRKFNNPYIMSFSLLLAEVAILEISRGTTLERIQCVFDRGIDKHKWLEQEYEGALPLLPKDMQQLMRPEPVFSDDMDFVPLQAADLRAWYSHRCLVDDRPQGLIWDELDKVKHASIHDDRTSLRTMLRGARVPTRIAHRAFLHFTERLRGRHIRLPSGKIL